MARGGWPEATLRGRRGGRGEEDVFSGHTGEKHHQLAAGFTPRGQGISPRPLIPLTQFQCWFRASAFCVSTTKELALKNWFQSSSTSAISKNQLHQRLWEGLFRPYKNNVTDVIKQQVWQLQKDYKDQKSSVNREIHILTSRTWSSGTDQQHHN